MNSDASEHSEERGQPERGAGEAASGCSLRGLCNPFPKPRCPEAPRAILRSAVPGLQELRPNAGLPGAWTLPSCPRLTPPWHRTPAQPQGRQERESLTPQLSPCPWEENFRAQRCWPSLPQSPGRGRRGRLHRAAHQAQGMERASAGRLCVPVYSGIIRKELLP